MPFSLDQIWLAQRGRSECRAGILADLETAVTQKWNDLVEHIAGTKLAGSSVPAAFYIDAIAAQTIDASQKSLANAARDSGVRYTFYLLTQVARASRSANWEQTLALHGIRLTPESTIFDLT